MWLSQEPDVSVAGEAGTPAEAVALVLRERPDLLFLDVQMPDGDGFDVLEGIGGEHLPEVIFVTAHERHALRAFDLAALDFLLKPVREERFRTALDRARRELARGEAREGPARLSALLDHVRAAREPGGPRRIERFAVRLRDRFVIVPASDVVWIGAAANYAELHLAGATHLVRATMAELEAGLDRLRAHSSRHDRASRLRPRGDSVGPRRLRRATEGRDRPDPQPAFPFATAALIGGGPRARPRRMMAARIQSSWCERPGAHA
jgi:two-component system LytT family response regulator